MKKHDWYLVIGAFVSFIIIISFEIVWKTTQEIFDGGKEAADILVSLSLSYFAGWIIYLISAYLPSKIEDELRKIEQEKKDENQRIEQERMDEIIAIRLHKLQNYCMHLLCSALDGQVAQQDVILSPLEKKEFSKLTENIFASKTVKNARSIRVHGEKYGRMMNVGENVLDHAKSILEVIDQLLKLDKYLDSELVSLLFQLEECSIVNNWENYIDDTPIVHGQQLLVPQESPLSELTEEFMKVDVIYRKLKIELDKLNHTEACIKYQKHIQLLIKNKVNSINEAA